MDPTQCYLEMMNAMRDGDFVAARERALALRDWLDRGGFYPPKYSTTEVRSYLANVLQHTATLDDADENP
jgi:hypothetical protein